MLNWLLKKLVSYGHPQAILAFSFGLREKTPGLSNEDLAKKVLHLQQETGLPLLVQWEIADAISQNSGDHQIEYIVRENQLDPDNSYLDTLAVLDQFARECQKHQWQYVYVVCNEFHSLRTLWILRKFNLKAAGIVTSTVYDVNSIQTWTRSPWRFINREIRSFFKLSAIKRYL